jgi:hypothetical protein
VDAAVTPRLILTGQPQHHRPNISARRLTTRAPARDSRASVGGRCRDGTARSWRGDDQPRRSQPVGWQHPGEPDQPCPVRPHQPRMNARPLTQGDRELMAQHQDLGALLPRPGSDRHRLPPLDGARYLRDSAVPILIEAVIATGRRWSGRQQPSRQGISSTVPSPRRTSAMPWPVDFGHAVDKNCLLEDKSGSEVARVAVRQDAFPDQPVDRGTPLFLGIAVGAVGVGEEA